MSNMLDDFAKYGKELVFLKLKEVAGWVVATIIAVILLIVGILATIDKTEQEIKCDAQDTNVRSIEEAI